MKLNNSLFPYLHKKEINFVWIWSGILILLTGLHLALGWGFEPAGSTYNGLHALSPGDVGVYYSYIHQVKEGEIFLKDLFTSESQTLGTFNVWWFAVGTLARLFDLSAPIAFSLARLVTIPLLFFTLYFLIAHIFQEMKQRQVAFVFTIFSGGLGILYATINSNIAVFASYLDWPIDLWLSEAFVFTTLYHSSHFIVSLISQIWLGLLMVYSFKTKKVGYAFLAGLLGLFYFNFHPYYAPTVFLMVGFYLLTKIILEKKFLWRESFLLGTAFYITLPSLAYHWYLIKNSEVIGTRALQNTTPNPDLFFYLLGFGLLIPGFLFGLYVFFIKKQRNDWLILLLCWALAAISLMLLPLPFQRKYTQGLQLVFSIFAVWGYVYYLQTSVVFSKIVNYNVYLTGMMIFLCFGTASLFSLARDILYTSKHPAQVQSVYYHSTDFGAALNWLKNQPAGLVIAPSDVDLLFVPGYTGQQVYAAHAHETLFFEPKFMMMQWFYQGSADVQKKQQWLASEGIDYVFLKAPVKPEKFDPSKFSNLEIGFNGDTVKIYSVNQR